MQQSSCCSSKVAHNALSFFMDWMVVGQDQGKVDRKVQERPKTKIVKEQKTQCMINILEQYMISEGRGKTRLR